MGGWDSDMCCTWGRSTISNSLLAANDRSHRREADQSRQVALFPETENCRIAALRGHSGPVIPVELESAETMGGMLAGLLFVGSLKLDKFWGPLLPESREGTRWLNVLKHW